MRIAATVLLLALVALVALPADSSAQYREWTVYLDPGERQDTEEVPFFDLGVYRTTATLESAGTGYVMAGLDNGLSREDLICERTTPGVDTITEDIDWSHHEGGWRLNIGRFTAAQWEAKYTVRYPYRILPAGD